MAVLQKVSPDASTWVVPPVPWVPHLGNKVPWVPCPHPNTLSLPHPPPPQLLVPIRWSFALYSRLAGRWHLRILVCNHTKFGGTASGNTSKITIVVLPLVMPDVALLSGTCTWVPLYRVPGTWVPGYLVQVSRYPFWYTYLGTPVQGTRYMGTQVPRYRVPGTVVPCTQVPGTWVPGYLVQVPGYPVWYMYPGTPELVQLWHI